jgi:hypothetical protein
MKVYVGLISSDTVLIQEFNAVKESLIPKAIRDKLPKNVILNLMHLIQWLQEENTQLTHTY